MDEYAALITPKIAGPYRAKTVQLVANLDGSVQSRTLIHDWTERNGRLVAIVDDMGDGGAPRIDYNPNADAAEIVSAYRDWLGVAYPSHPRGYAGELAVSYMVQEEGRDHV